MRWLRDYVEPSLSLRTHLRYRDVVEHDLMPHLGSLPLQRLKPAHIVAAEQPLRVTGLNGSDGDRHLPVGASRHMGASTLRGVGIGSVLPAALPHIDLRNRSVRSRAAGK